MIHSAISLSTWHKLWRLVYISIYKGPNQQCCCATNISIGTALSKPSSWIAKRKRDSSFSCAKSTCHKSKIPKHLSWANSKAPAKSVACWQKRKRPVQGHRYREQIGDWWTRQSILVLSVWWQSKPLEYYMATMTNVYAKTLSLRLTDSPQPKENLVLLSANPLVPPIVRVATKHN